MKQDKTDIGIIGTSIWQQNMPLLERLIIDRDERAELLQELKVQLGLDELIYLATCNRVEFIYVSSGKLNDRQILHRIIDAFVCGRDSISFFPNDFYHFTGKDAVSHLFKTTSSLESLVVGETQITGQFKEAYLQAQETGLCGPILDKLAQEALLTARRVKRETNIGAGCLSMASLAASELKRQLNGRPNSLVALVGSGPMTEKMAKYFAEDISIQVLFVNRTIEKAEKLAEQFGGQALSLESFLSTPPVVDGIVSATAATEPIFDATFVGRLRPSNLPLVCIDLAIPRDFSLDFDSDRRVSLVDIQVLKSREAGNRRQKFAEASQANDIVREAVKKYLSDRIEIHLKPIFRDCHKESMELATQALNDLFAKRVTSINETDKAAVIHLVTRLIGQSAFQPVRKLSESMVRMQSEINLSNDIPQQRQAV